MSGLNPIDNILSLIGFVKNWLLSFFGPFPIIARVGSVAYKLQLPSISKIHHIFHIFQLRKHVGQQPYQATLLEIDDQGLLAAEPIGVLDKKFGKRGNHAMVYLLIQWSTRSKEDATWEVYTGIEKRFPQFVLSA